MEERSVKRKLSTPTGMVYESYLSSTESSVTGDLSSRSGSTTPPGGSTNNANPKPSDNDLVSAAEALTQLTQIPSSSSTATIVSTGATRIPQAHPSTGSSIASPLSALSIQNNEIQLPPIKSPQLEQLPKHPLVAGVNKVTRHPLVTNAVKYYDYSKRTYAPFNYAAGIVEKAAIPVVNKIEDNLNSRYQAKQARIQSQTSTNTKKRRLDEPISSTLSGSLGESSNVSLETKKRLQFCLHILRLANDKINNLVCVLQERVVNKENEAKEKRDAAALVNNEVAQRTNTEIVTTVKNIIRLISNFKPSSLSAKDEASRATSPQPKDESTSSASDTEMENEKDEHHNHHQLHKEEDEDDQLKGTIRDIILSLPATIQQQSPGPTNDRILVFAKESLEMILRLTTVFNVQLEKAEAWVAGEQQLQEQEMEQERRDIENKRFNGHIQSPIGSDGSESTCAFEG